METKVWLYSAALAVTALALGAALIWYARKSAFQQGIVAGVKTVEQAVVSETISGDERVARIRDPHDVSIDLEH